MQCNFCELARAQSDPSFIIDFGTTHAMVDWDQRYKGSCLLVLNKHYENLVDVPKDELDVIMGDLQRLGRAMRTASNPAKMNFLMLGNSVSHLHWYVICRYDGDENWGGPPIFKRDYPKLANEAYTDIAKLVREHL